MHRQVRDSERAWLLAMIISKDLFLLGEQDYLRLPKDEKRRSKVTSNNATGNGGGVASSVGVGGNGSGVLGETTGDGAAGGGGLASATKAAVIASKGMGKDPNDDLR